ncbi:hypothetical protein JCM16358_17640 [Halanaerocella petrolearia]
MTEEKEEELTIIDLIRLQLIWYIINFLVIFCQNHIQFELPYFNDLYQIIFKIIGRSFFISFVLYWITNYDISFSELGINFNWTSTKVGVRISSFLLLGMLIINLSFTKEIITPLIDIRDVTDLTSSFFYLLLLIIGYLIPAFSKELFYRGFIYYHFREKFGGKLAFIISNLYYTISYLDIRLNHLVIYLLIGIITTYLYHKTESLLAPTIFQTIYQASLTLYLFGFSEWLF